MKCIECLEEISEREYNNKSLEGVCKKCRQRRAQHEYLNRKNGTNKEYVPVKLRKNTRTTVRTKSIEPKVESKQNDDKIYDNIIKDEVVKDIQETFKKYGVFIKENDAVPLQMFMQMFISLLDVKNGYMLNFIKAEDIFNSMETDYRHMVEDAKSFNLFVERSQKYRCLLDERRNVKNVNVQYSKISRLIMEIVEKIPDILERAVSAQEDLNKIIDLQNNHSYMARASELVQEEDFCIGKKITNAAGQSKFHVSVPLYNYYGNVNSPYNFTRMIWALDKQDAIAQLKSFLAEKLPTCTYKEEKIIAVNLYRDDIEVKECL